TTAKTITDSWYSGSAPKDRPWVTMGSVDVSGGANVLSTSNELTFNFAGQQFDVQISAANYSATGLVNALQGVINSALSAAGITNGVVVGFDANTGALTFTAEVAGSDEAGKFEVVG